MTTTEQNADRLVAIAREKAGGYVVALTCAADD